MSDRPLMVTEDRRAELQSAAASAERASRPRWLVWLGALAVLGALLFAGVRLVQRTSVASELASDRDLTEAIARKVGELQAADEFESALGGADRLAPDPRMLGKISQAARDLGLTVALESEADDTRPRPAKMSRKAFTLSFTAQPAEGLFAWLRKVTSELPGVQVKRLEIRPSEATSDGKPGWKLDVVLTRWEKQAP